MKVYQTTKKTDKVSSSIYMPPALAHDWLEAARAEGISRQEFLRRALGARAKNILATRSTTNESE